VITQYQDVAYDRLAEEARAPGLDLNWSSRIPYSRLTLAAAETVRINQPGSNCASPSRRPLNTTSAERPLARRRRVIAGLRPPAFFIALSRTLTSRSRPASVGPRPGNGRRR
jgi:hypothetical protein